MMYKAEDKKPKTCHDVFSMINDRQIEAVMFHDQMADYFRFLGYEGYSCIHEYQYHTESLEHRNTKRYYLTMHNKILKEGEIPNPKAIPIEWYSRQRHEASDSVKLKAVRDGMDTYKKWESDTLKCYESYAKALFEMGKMADYQYVMYLIEDVCCELKEIDKIILSLIGTDYDMVYIEESQHKIAKKYKEKM